MRRFFGFMLASCLMVAPVAAQQVTPPSKEKVDKIRRIEVVEPTQITLNKGEVYAFIAPGILGQAREGYQLKATVLPENATNKNVVWESSDTSVAGVDAKGYVTPVKLGSAVVRAYTQANRLAAECNVFVEGRNGFSGNTISNLNNRGYMAVQGTWIYFANPNDGMRLYKMKMDGSRKTKLSNDVAQYLNVMGSKVYYVNTSDGKKLYSIDVYGENRKWLNDANPAFCAQVHGQKIFYTSLNPDHRVHLYHMDTDGTSRGLVDWPGLGSISSFYRVGDSVLYGRLRSMPDGTQQTAGIHYRPLSGSEPGIGVVDALLKDFSAQVVRMGDSEFPLMVAYIPEGGEIRRVENFIQQKKKQDKLVISPRLPAKGLSVKSDWIYYYNKDTIGKVRFDGRENQTLARIPNDATVRIFPVSGGQTEEDIWIYYYVLQDGATPKLYKVRANGLENTQVL